MPTYTGVGTTYFMPRLDINSSMRGIYDVSSDDGIDTLMRDIGMVLGRGD